MNMALDHVSELTEVSGGWQLRELGGFHWYGKGMSQANVRGRKRMVHELEEMPSRLAKKCQRVKRVQHGHAAVGRWQADTQYARSPTALELAIASVSRHVVSESAGKRARSLERKFASLLCQLFEALGYPVSMCFSNRDDRPEPKLRRREEKPPPKARER